MNAIRKIIKVRKSSITLNELSEFNGRNVEVIILPLTEQDENTDYKKNILKYSGIIKSNFTDTSEKVDSLIYAE